MRSGYRPIESYGVIGDVRTIALVCKDGGIDWCCLPQIDDASVFGALLDESRGGRFHVRAQSSTDGQQRYLEHTNVLETTFDGEQGRLVVTDFMPLAGEIEGCGASRTEHAIYRLLRAEGGPVDVELEWSPRFQYGKKPSQVVKSESGYLAFAGVHALTLAGAPDEARVTNDAFGQLVQAHFRLQAGEQRALISAFGARTSDATLPTVHQKLEDTIAVWRRWVHKEEATGDRSWAGAHSELIIRSELVLKLLTHIDTGAMAAAGTASLPETLGGVRNWDYRFTWVRDAALAAQALYALGHEPEARAFIQWLERAAQQKGERSFGLQIVYGLHGENELDEHELIHLEGYERSGPVRIGNGAWNQLQLDIYGELVSAAYELVRMGTPLEPAISEFLPRVVDQACENSQKPDYGIWEVRDGPFHFVYSKAMVWMALDRASRLHRRGVIQGNIARWNRTKEALRSEVLEHGFDTRLGAFKQSYERSVLDASNLLLPLFEFLPFEDARVQATIDTTLRDLTEQGLVYRYRTDDGIAGHEGAFVLCSFWLVDALTLSGRMDEAQSLYEGLLRRANHVGLYSEQIDPTTGRFLGNFPQAFSHIGLINSSLYLAYKLGRPTPVPAPIGSPEHRAEAEKH